MSDMKNLWKSGYFRDIMEKREWLPKNCVEYMINGKCICHESVLTQGIRFLSRVYMPWNGQRHAMGNSHFAG